MLAVELVRRGAARHRDRVAVQVGGEAMTYAEVIDQAERITRSLLGLGLTPGTPIALLLDNGRYSMPVDFALLLGGFVRVPLNSRLTAAEHAQSAVGKVLRRALRDPLWAGAGQRREERL